MDQRPPLPPFSLETAIEKVRKAENAGTRAIPLRSPSGIAPTVSGETGLNFWWVVRPSWLF